MVFFRCSHFLVSVTHRIKAFTVVLKEDYGDKVKSVCDSLCNMVNQYENEVIPKTKPLIQHVSDIKSVLTLVNELGSGSQGTVYYARFLYGKEVAVKVESRSMTKKERENFMV